MLFLKISYFMDIIQFHFLKNIIISAYIFFSYLHCFLWIFNLAVLVFD